MKGSIRAFVGFLIAFGAVGQSDFDPTTPFLQTVVIAGIGLALMASGIKAMNRG